MARGALRGAVAAWAGLIALDALVGTQRGSAATSGVMSFAASVVNRALSPDVALIPDYSKGPSSSGGLDPVVTGAAAPDTSTGHDYNLPVTAPAPSLPAPSTNPVPRPGAAVAA